MLLLIPAALILLVFLSRRSLANISKKRLIATMVLRGITVSMLILALAGPAVPETSDRLNLLLLVDRSLSVDTENDRLIIRYISETQKLLRADDRIGLITFDSTVMLRHRLEPIAGRDLTTAFSAVSRREGTALASAISLAANIMPSDGANRLVVFSDFNETIGSAEASIGRLNELGIEVHTIPLYSDRNEVLVKRLDAPEYASKLETYAVSAIIESQAETSALIRLYRDGVIIDEEEVVLPPGLSRYDYYDVGLEEGLVSYKVEVMSDGDRVRENNTGESFTLVRKDLSVLFVHSGSAGRDDYVARMLSEAGFSVDRVSHYNLPDSPFGLAEYDVVIVNDVSAYELGLDFMRSIRIYVEDLGGGLIVVGGSQSFGMGAYKNTFLEEVLPVTSDVRRQELSRRIALAIVLDRSGSMGTGMGRSKLDIAKEAAIEAMGLLHPEDEFGLLAFDRNSSWAVPLDRLGECQPKEDLIRAIQASGGTDLPSAALRALEAIKHSARDTKHIIVLSDGQTTGTIGEIISKSTDYGVTVSTVAVGADANTALLSELADQTGGAYYFTDDPFDIPSIVLKDTMSIARSSVVEESFRPVPVVGSPIIDTVNWTAAPELDGYVATTAKPFADFLLGGKYLGDPLLATARFGSGKSAAFTSDIGGLWSKNWASWDGAAVFWRQLVRWARSSLTDFPYEVVTHTSGDRLTVVVDAIDERGGFVNGLRLRSIVLSPDGSHQQAELVQTGPGRYETTFTLQQSGGHVLQTQLIEFGVPVSGQTSFFSRAYDAEFAEPRTNINLAAVLADRTGGKIYADVHDVTRRGVFDTSLLREMWRVPVLLSLLVFLVELGIRYVVLPGNRRARLKAS
jgi:uncharacterized membrane protein